MGKMNIEFDDKDAQGSNKNSTYYRLFIVI